MTADFPIADKQDTGRVRLGLPWHLPFYRALNGAHPLVDSFVNGHRDVATVACAPTAGRDPAALQGMMGALCARTRGLAAEHRGDYLKWIDPHEQASIDAQASLYDALFTHTAPFYLGVQPWIFHFESLPTVFSPFVNTGNCAGIALRQLGVFGALKETFAAASCKAIFTHMRSSREAFGRVFDDAAIADKLHHVPLGIAALDESAALAKFDAPGPLRILFTNSLHQNPISFFLRGGHHLLHAFNRLRQEGVDVELTVISSVPHTSSVAAPERNIPGVTWVTERISDGALDRLLREHHVFALPAAGLHSFSLLRALSHGCVPIVSDALGYEEYTQEIEESVFLVRGVRAAVYRAESEGWTSDHYAGYLTSTAQFAPQIHRALNLAGDRERLRRMAQANLRYCRQRHDPGLSQALFFERVALAAGRPRSAAAPGASPRALEAAAA